MLSPCCCFFERFRDREIPSTGLPAPKQMPPTAPTESGLSQKPGTPARSPTGITLTQVLEQSPLPPRVHTAVKSDWGMEAGLQSRRSNTGCGHCRRHLHHYGTARCVTAFSNTLHPGDSSTRLLSSNPVPQCTRSLPLLPFSILNMPCGSSHLQQLSSLPFRTQVAFQPKVFPFPQ